MDNLAASRVADTRPHARMDFMARLSKRLGCSPMAGEELGACVSGHFEHCRAVLRTGDSDISRRTHIHGDELASWGLLLEFPDWSA